MQGRELQQRRLKMLTLKSQGVKLASIIEDFKKEYNVSIQALYKDWKNREAWASDVVTLNDPALITELIHGLKQVIPSAWFQYKTNPNPSVQLGALKLVAQTYRDLITILQSLGVVIRVPEKIDLNVKSIDSALEEYEAVINQAAKINLQAHNPKQPLDTSHITS